MDANVIKHIHWLFIALYLLFYLVKSFYFLTGDTQKFQSIRKKTLIIENVFAVGFLVTGVIMLVRLGTGWMEVNGWFHIKLTLVILSIPLGIVGFKRNSKALVGLSVIFLLYVLGLALTKSPTLFF